MYQKNYYTESAKTRLMLDKNARKAYNEKKGSIFDEDDIADSALSYLYNDANKIKTQDFLKSNGFPTAQQRAQNQQLYGAAKEQKQIRDLLKSTTKNTLNPNVTKLDHGFLQGMYGDEEGDQAYYKMLSDASLRQRDMYNAFQGSPFESMLNPSAPVSEVTQNSILSATNPTSRSVLDPLREYDTTQYFDTKSTPSGIADKKETVRTHDTNSMVSKAGSSGKISEFEYASGEWNLNRDAHEFGKQSDTYKILGDLEKRWYTTNDAKAKDELNNMAKEARRLAREGTPLMYGQEKVMSLLHANAQEAQRYMDEFRSFRLYDWSKDFDYRVAYLISKTDKGDWDYKYNPVWQVPYSQFNAKNMNVDNNKNWNAWIYFDGMIMGADKLGNVNMAYVGVKLGLPHYIYQNFTTTDKDDAFWVQYGINMAKQGR